MEISYIYYGDLLNVALTVLKPVDKGGVGGDASNELKLIVGAYSFTDLQTGKQRSVNLADLPISLERFKVWFLENIGFCVCAGAIFIAPLPRAHGFPDPLTVIENASNHWQIKQNHHFWGRERLRFLACALGTPT